MFSLFQDDPIQRRVYNTYLKMHTYQTVNFVEQKINQWCQFNKTEMTIMDALNKLNDLVDESDPDVDMPNIVHAFQTAEEIRRVHPELDWFQLTGLIHDLGKIMAFYGEPQWSVVGDTFPVGCAFSNSIVYHDSTFQRNPDLYNNHYNTKFGLYSPNCGLENVNMSWGHDEYLYRVLKNHPNMTLPDESLYCIRFHSFYPWHMSNDYMFLCSDKDMRMYPWIKEFNKFDLYTKCERIPDIDELTPYYQSIIDKYVPGIVKF